jgi:chromosome segregation ATPase
MARVHTPAVTISGVARAAHVTREFIHSHSDLREAVAAAQERQRRLAPPSLDARSPDPVVSGLQAEKGTLLAEISRLREELADRDRAIGDLQQQRLRWLGRQVGSASVDVETLAELRVSNEQLLTAKTALEAEVVAQAAAIKRLEQQLDASRQAHRQDMATWREGAHPAVLDLDDRRGSRRRD